MLFVLFSAPLYNLAKPPAPNWDHISVKHTWNSVPSSWESLGPPPSGTTIDLNIVLMPQNESALIDALYDVSNPGSARHVIFETLLGCTHLCHCRYGEHLSKEGVAQLVSPHQDSLELVRSWIGNHHIPSSSISTTRGGSLLTLRGLPVSQANELLDASYQLYRYAGTNDTAILRTIGYSLPAVLHAHVKTIVPTTHLSTRPLWKPPPPQKRFANATGDIAPRGPVQNLSSRDDDYLTPSFLRSLYRMAEYVPAATDQNVLGVTAFLNEYPNPTDFTTFMTRCRSDAVDPHFTFVPVNNGGYDEDNPGLEANSNIQYTEALVYPTSIIFYSTGGDVEVDPQTNEPGSGDAFFEWLKFVLDKAAVPQTITISYSIFEKDIPLEYAMTLCDMFGELGARGSSVLIASGNDAVGTIAGRGECFDAYGRPQFLTHFPPTCMSTIKSVLTANGGGYKLFTTFFAVS